MLQLFLIERDTLLKDVLSSDMQIILRYNNWYQNALLSHEDKRILSDLKSDITLSDVRIAQLKELYNSSKYKGISEAERESKFRQQVSREVASKRNLLASQVMSQRIVEEIYKLDCDYLDTKDVRVQKDLLCHYLALCMLISQYPVLANYFKKSSSLAAAYHRNRVMFTTFDPDERCKEMKKYIRLFRRNDRS